MARVIGREAELRTVEQFLDAVRDRAGVLVIRGEPGIGKTTVLTESIERATARGFQVLIAHAAAAEASLTLTTLGDLLEGVAPAESDLALPEPQRRALDAALLADSGEAGPMQARVLGAAVRSVLIDLAARAPVIVAIDDAQWADAPSATVLSYAIRRLTDQPVGLVLAQRSGGALPFEVRALVPPDRIWPVDVGPLTVAALHYVLREWTGTSPSRSALVRIHEASRGNPLFALEITRLLGTTGLPPGGQPLPVPADVRALFRERVGSLAPGVRELLLLAAALGRAPVDLLEQALGRAITEDAAGAEAADVAWIEAGSLVFRHPLLAGVVYAEASPSARRRAHGRLAAVLDGVEERARHRALSIEGPDRGVAEELEAAASLALNRAAPAAAADLLRLAIEATPPDAEGDRQRRGLDLGGYLKRAGDADGAINVLESVVAAATDRSTRARARLALVAMRYETDEAGLALGLAEAAIEDAADDLGLRARANAVAAAVDWEDFARRSRRTDEASRLLAQVADPEPEVVGIVLMERISADQDAGLPRDPELVARALEAERLAPPINVADRFSASLGTFLKYEDDLAGAREWIERTIQTAVDEGDEGSLPYAVSHMVEVELWAGDWPSAEELARRHLELSVELNLESQRRQALYNLALVLAHRGGFDEARALIAEGLRAAAADEDAWTRATLVPILGLIELSVGDLRAAAGHLRLGSKLRDEMGQATPRRHDPDLVEALVGLGELDEAREVVAAMDRRAAVPRTRSSALALLARCHALLAAADGHLDEAAAAAASALDHHARVTFPFDRARTLLALGQIERRRRERRAAKAAFDEALAEFERLGAPAWAERARTEIARLGMRRAPQALTETERRVAELAGSGLTNREIAATLFISPKTVEANLGRAYGKLGIRSRAQLAQALQT